MAPFSLQKLNFPFTIVCYHLVIKFIMSACVRTSLRLANGKTRVQLDWKTSVRKMAPTGIASGIDIGFSSWGLELVKISLYTMTKSSTIIFILIFAILLGLEKKVWKRNSRLALHSVSVFFLELGANGHCGHDSHWAIYVHIQVDAVRCAGLYIFVGGVTQQWNPVDFRTVIDAKVQTGTTQPGGHDLPHAAVDDTLDLAVHHWFRR